MLQLRAIVVGLTGAFVFAASAQAADPAWRAPPPIDAPVLRGSAYEGEPAAAPPRFLPEWPVYRRWQGFYVGGQIGRSSVNADFSNASKGQISYILANTDLLDNVAGFQTLPKSSHGGTTFGGFIGYNAQWNDAVVGAELNYRHIGVGLTARDSIGPLLVPGGAQSDGSTITYSVAVSSGAAVTIHDLLTARARFAWAVDRWLPYAFVGAAAARAETSASTVLDVFKAVTPPPIVDAFGNSIPQPRGPFNPVTLPRNPQIETRSTVAYGYTAGLGLDVAVTSNVFLRAEWEYVQFLSINNIRVNMNSGQVGVGVKF
jgi:outer membrane immunogenic protein